MRPRYRQRHTVNYYLVGWPSDINQYHITSALTKWVNACFDSTTTHYFFTGSVKHTDKYPTNGYSFNLGLPNFAINVYLVPDASQSGGLNHHQEDGSAAVVVGYIHSDLETVSLQLKNGVLHEIGHAFGCGIGEYNKLKTHVDLSGVLPELKVSILMNDHYWSRPHRSLWKRDVLLNMNAETPMWCNLSTLVINHGLWREMGPPCPPLWNVKVATGHRSTLVDVYKYNVTGYGLVVSEFTDADGILQFDWGTSPDTAVTIDQFRKLIIHDKTVSIARGISIFDLQEAWLVGCERAKVIGKQSYDPVDYHAVL